MNVRKMCGVVDWIQLAVRKMRGVVKWIHLAEDRVIDSLFRTL
jgi:hypothetical protein